MKTLRVAARIALVVVSRIDRRLRSVAWRDAELDYPCKTCGHSAYSHGAATDGPCGTSPNRVRGACLLHHGCPCLAMTPPMLFHRDREPEVLA